MEISAIKPEKHIIVCVNERENKDCCKNVGGEEIYMKLKEYVKSNNIANKVWVTRARCLGFCNNTGATIVVYPEGKWFLKVKIEEISKVIDFVENS